MKSSGKNRKFQSFPFLCRKRLQCPVYGPPRRPPRTPQRIRCLGAPSQVQETPELARNRGGPRPTACRAAGPDQARRKLKRLGEILEYPNGRVALPKERQAAAQSLPRQGITPLRNGRLPRRSAVSGRPSAASQLTGRLLAHRDGYGFVVPDSPREDLEGDLFIGRDAIGDAIAWRPRLGEH